jgi:hypothetical protein
MSAPQLFVGVDVANAQLDIAVRPTGERGAVANDSAGIATLVARLQAIQPTLMVFEQRSLEGPRILQERGREGRCWRLLAAW